MIDYGLTFTKRGRKPYLTITHKEVCHIYSKLTFQGYFLINRDGSKIPPGSIYIILIIFNFIFDFQFEKKTKNK